MKKATRIVTNSWRHTSNHLHLLGNIICSEPIVSLFSSKIVYLSESRYTCEISNTPVPFYKLGLKGGNPVEIVPWFYHLK